jgi:putative ABC transport system permease protein
MRLMAGRDFNEADTQGAPLVVLVNETAARRFWPGKDPLGQRVYLLGREKSAGAARVVGVVADVKYAGFLRRETEPRPQVYVPYLQDPDALLDSSSSLSTLIVRTRVGPARAIAEVRDRIRLVDPKLPSRGLQTVEEQLADRYAGQRHYAVLLGSFAALALLLAVVGIYGVMSYSVSQRLHEIGVRMALGAQSTDILFLVVGRGLLYAVCGVGIGVGAALGLTRLLRAELYGVTPTDPATFAGVALLMLLVALTACYVPARRAVRVDPVRVLRYE